MTRHKFAHEGIVTLGRLIQVGAIKWDEGAEIPVVWQFDFTDIRSLLGVARDIQREVDGTLTAEIDWNEKVQPFVDSYLDQTFFLTIYANQVDREKKDGIEIVSSCKLRCISTSLSDPWVEQK